MLKNIQNLKIEIEPSWISKLMNLAKDKIDLFVKFMFVNLFDKCIFI